MAFVLRRQPVLSPKHAAFPYQLDAIRAVQNLPYAAFFHEQGLGKTKIAIDLALLWLQDDAVETVFIVTKKSLVDNWRKEISGHCHITPHVLSGNRRENSVSLNLPVLLYVTNYEVIATNTDVIGSFLRTCRVGCILDESQKIKNPEAALTRTYHELAPLFQRRVIMTGTPAANRPYDIWAQIKFLDGGESLGHAFGIFRQEMDLPTRASAAVDYADRLETIHERVAEFTVRETKDTAGLQLPEKTITTRLVDLPEWQMAKYMAYRDDLAYGYELGGIASTDDVESLLKRLLRLVQCASNPALIDGRYDLEPGKYFTLLDMCEDLSSESKLIVWTGFVDNVDWLASKLARFEPVRIHGQLSIRDRNRAVELFTQSSRRLLIATPGAAKEGLTLTVANHAIFYDRGFSLDDYLQAQDRIHRISQTRECHIHNLIANGTIDEWVDVLLSAKYRAAQLAQGDIGASEFNEVFRTDVTEVLQGVLFPQRGIDSFRPGQPASTADEI